MARRFWLTLILACAACADRSIPLSCPTGTRASGDRCKVVCLSQDDCVAGERCVEGLCEIASGSDAAIEDGATRDASARDAGAFDAALADAAIPDATLADATLADAAIPDATLPDATAPDAGVSCHGLDEQACQAAPRCTAYRCPTCNGSQFVVCADPGEGPPPCAAPQCSCVNFGVGDCAARPECIAFHCLDCAGNNNFMSCADQGTTSPCTSLACGCEQHHDEQSCAADAVCHPIFTQVCEGDPNMPQCFMRFSRCGNGARTICDGPVMCRSLPPTCTGGMSVATNGVCYDGCVRPDYCVR